MFVSVRGLVLSPLICKMRLRKKICASGSLNISKPCCNSPLPPLIAAVGPMMVPFAVSSSKSAPSVNPKVSGGGLTCRIVTAAVAVCE